MGLETYFWDRTNDQPVVVIGHEKGNDTKSRIERNFGMARADEWKSAGSFRAVDAP